MRRLNGAMAAVVVALATLLVGTGRAEAAQCVAFVHGTGDQTVSSATNGYWKQSTIDQFRAGRGYVVVGYKGTSYPAFDERSWGDVTKQIYDYQVSHGCTQWVIVTHSNGSNPVRYMVMHPTARTSSTHGGISVSSVTNKLRKVVFLALDGSGTILADKVTTNGTLLNLANAVTSFLGLMNYNTPAVWQQRRDRMSTYNSDGTFNNSANACGYGRTTCGGFASEHSLGRSVTAAFWKSSAYCGGYFTTLGLKATLIYGWGWSGCADGFIGCSSQSYNGTEIISTKKLNHNQSRRTCDDLEDVVSHSVQSAYYVHSDPPDPNVSPAAQACDATWRGWWGPYGDWFNYGCTSSMRSNGYTDHDCAVAYQSDNGVTLSNGYYSTAYSNSAYYSGSACPDSWRGDGICDMCIVAKYGFDAMEGQADGADDCRTDVSTNHCSDLTYDYYYGWVRTYDYYVSH